MVADRTRDPGLFCSFCGKSQKEVKKLIAGPAVYICNECVQLCHEIIMKKNEVVDNPAGVHPRLHFQEDGHLLVFPIQK